MSVDYAFSGTGFARQRPLVSRCTGPLVELRMGASIFQRKEWEHPYGAQCLLRYPQERGYKLLIVNLDQEPAIRAQCTEVPNKFSGEVLPEVAPEEGREMSSG